MNKFVLPLVLVFAQSSFAQRTQNHEAIIDQACTKTGDVLVIDTYDNDPSNEENIDLDGDGEFETHHGAFVEKVVEKNGQGTQRLGVGSPLFPHQLLEMLLPIAEKVEKKEMQLAWINFSQGYAMEIRKFTRLIKSEERVTYDNIHLYAERILDALAEENPELRIPELKEVFTRLHKAGVPFVAAGTNSGFQQVNFYSLFQNVISVGALDANDKKAPYSADNSLVTVWRLGNIRTYSIGNRGIDISGDGRVDIEKSFEPIPMSELQELQGKNAYEIEAEIPKDIEDANDNNKEVFSGLIAKLPRGLYKTNEILKRTLGTPFFQAQHIKGLGTFVYVDGVSKKPMAFLKVDSSGVLKITEELLNENNQYRNTVEGTSFATPNICNGQQTPDNFAL